jgi:HEAT repeats
VETSPHSRKGSQTAAAGSMRDEGQVRLEAVQNGARSARLLGGPWRFSRREADPYAASRGTPLCCAGFHSGTYPWQGCSVKGPPAVRPCSLLRPSRGGPRQSRCMIAVLHRRSCRCGERLEGGCWPWRAACRRIAFEREKNPWSCQLVAKVMRGQPSRHPTWDATMKGAIMRNARWCGYGAVSLTLMFSWAMVVAGVAAERLPAPATNPSTLDVAYDPATGLISIQAHDTPLGTVLQALSQKVSFRIEALHKGLLDEQIAVEVRYLSLEQALRKLLERFNAIFLYSSAPDQLIRVILLSRKTPRPSEAPIGPATAKEGEQAIEAFLETVQDKDRLARADAIAALKGSAPEKAVAVLETWLQGKDQQVRVFAAEQLGEVGGDRAIEALSALLTGDDPRIRQAAAHSLARIGGEGVRQTLLAAYREGDKELKRDIARALQAVSHEGDTAFNRDSTKALNAANH